MQIFIDGLVGIIVRTEDFHRLLVAVSNELLTLKSLLEYSVVDRLQFRHRRDFDRSCEALIPDQ